MTESVIDAILRREGGWVDHPADRPTNFGITLETLSDVLERPATVEELRSLTEDQAREIYRRRYVLRPKLDRVLHDELRELLIDCGVNHGPRRAVRWLQAALGFRAGAGRDGIIGPVTTTALQRANPEALYFRVLGRRVRLYGRLVSRDPELRRAREAGFHLQATFSAGWNARAAEFIDAAARW